jgi:hypothetical protein
LTLCQFSLFRLLFKMHSIPIHQLFSLAPFTLIVCIYTRRRAALHEAFGILGAVETRLLRGRVDFIAKRM